MKHALFVIACYGIPSAFMLGLGYIWPEYGIFIGCAICLIVGIIHALMTGEKLL